LVLLLHPLADAAAATPAVEVMSSLPDAAAATPAVEAMRWSLAAAATVEVLTCPPRRRRR
jgi:hypothetical protein